MVNPFVVLEIPKSSSENDIRHAFRTKAKKYHPDVCKEDNASEKFKTYLEAYELLKSNNWKWDEKSINKIDLNKIYADFIRKNPVYAYYFNKETLKAQARWDSLRKRPE